MTAPVRTHNSFARRILGVMAGITICSVVSVTVTLTYHEYLNTARALEQTLDTQVAMLARNLTAAVTFEDGTAASEILATLAESPATRSAIVTTADGARLATYGAEADPASEAKAFLGAAGLHYDGDALWAVRVIEHDGARVGRLAVSIGLQQLRAQMVSIVTDAVLVCLLALGVALLLALRLGRALVRPVTELAQLAEAVSQTHDYGLRAKVTSNDELGRLTAVINQMLYRIGEQDSQLRRWAENLEERVAERTQDLRRATEAAEAASRAKSDFLANMSHEIRTPMTAILGFVEILMNETLSAAERREYMDTVRKNGDHLLSVINDILDLSRIEANRLSCEPRECPLGRFLREIDSLFSIRAREAGLSFEIEIETPVPRVITTDPVRLRQILINLVGNALKFTKRGTIRVATALRADANGRPQLEISVTDSGVGMTPDQLGRLFRPFVQADETVTRRFGGTGLGLAISKRLAEMLGGDVTATSNIGVGSTFTVTIDPGPVGAQETVRTLEELLTAPPGREPATAKDPTSPTLAGLRVLLAEDGPDNQRLISFLLHRAGAIVTVAGNGAEAVAAWLATDSSAPFDLVLMDMQMPVLDGYAATRRLRELECGLPIIALTAHSMEGDRERCLDAGCSGYSTKPIQRAELFALIDKLVDRVGSRRAAEESKTPESADLVPES
ncbi:MAG: ATP-binding protein [Planctomycetota bacterium]